MQLPTEIIEVRDGKPMVSSLQVAERFGKQHKNVLAAIQNTEMSEEFRGLNFKPENYADAQGKPRPCYWMTRDGFWALAMTFTGAEAARLREGIINALNKAEEVIKNPLSCADPVSIVRHALEIVERTVREKDALTEENKSLARDRMDMAQEAMNAQHWVSAYKAAMERVYRHSYAEFKKLENMQIPGNDLFPNHGPAGNITSLPKRP